MARNQRKRSNKTSISKSEEINSISGQSTAETPKNTDISGDFKHPPLPQDNPPELPKPKRVPISLEDILEKRKKEDAAKSKPVFLTKEQRAQLALERRQKVVNEMKSQNISQSIPQLSEKSESISRFTGPSLTEAEREQIKKRYMGSTESADTKRLGKRRKNDKKFVFEWDDEEDTSKDLDSDTLIERKDRKIMFGRGRLAGMGTTEEFPTIKKSKWDDMHWKDKPLESMSDRDWRIFKEDFNISTKGGRIPKPIRWWDEAPFSGKIKKVLQRIGYQEPTPIQRQAIPIGLQNRDMIGVAETGSGKTAAFLIPMLEFLFRLPRISEANAADGPYAIVLVPTRELAQQIEKEAKRFSEPLGFQCLSIVGGHSIDQQANALRRGIEIVIATPGRLLDCIDRRMLVLNQCTYIVLDEADRMIDMGFENEVNFLMDSLPVSSRKPNTDEAIDHDKMIVNGLPKYRQTTMFSATMPPPVEKIARKYMSHPAMVTIGIVGQTVDRIKQRVEVIKSDAKNSRLIQILSEGWRPPVIVFVNMKMNAEVIGKILEQEGHKVSVLHGGKSQDTRELALNSLRRGDKHVLVATDVASRGIDVPNVSLVINYDMAKNIEDYTHRIGRTGRAGKSGVAITFLTLEDTHVFYDLKQMLQKSNSPIPSELSRHEATKIRPLGQRQSVSSTSSTAMDVQA